MTVGQVAEALQVSEDTVYRLLDDGYLDRTEVRRAVRIPQRSLQRYIADHTRVATRTSPAPAA